MKIIGEGASFSAWELIALAIVWTGVFIYLLCMLIAKIRKNKNR